jgi:general nucleoside transport system permease protein
MKTLLRELIFPLIAVIAAFIIGGVIIFAIRDNPFEVYGILLSSAFGLYDAQGHFTFDNWGYTLFYATPLIFTGLSVAIALRCGLLNIGAEGQLYMGAFAAAWVGLTFTGLPSIILVPFAILAAMIAGGFWGAVPGILKARFGSHEVINTIMMNFIALGLLSYLVQYHFKEPSDAIMETHEIVPAGRFARFYTLLKPFGINFPYRIPLNATFLLAILACFLVWVFLWKTKWGYELRAAGASPDAAEYAGISVKRQVMLAMALSGAIAGLVGVNEVLGYRYRYYHDFSAQYGFTGIAVALLGRNHPFGVFLAAILFGALVRGGLFVDIFTENVSKDLVQVLQAIIILLVAMEYFFRGKLQKLIPQLAGK